MYRDTFKKRHTVLPVIHAENIDQTLKNIQIIQEEGADGAFLVNHSISHEELRDIYNSCPSDFWIGLNFLGMKPIDAFAQSQSENGLWIDDACINEKTPIQKKAEEIEDAREDSLLYFGGVAFKYRRKVEDLEAAAKIATQYMDVVTTSGPGTGKEADIDKIRRMKEAIGDFPLAIASGITPENVTTYMPYVDCFLVATGISDSFTELSRDKLRSLLDNIGDS